MICLIHTGEEALVLSISVSLFKADDRHLAGQL